MQWVEGPFAGVIPVGEVGPVSEDCLTLNVWAPEGQASGLPVMMWVPGGAFLTGQQQRRDLRRRPPVR